MERRRHNEEEKHHRVRAAAFMLEVPTVMSGGTFVRAEDENSFWANTYQDMAEICIDEFDEIGEEDMLRLRDHAKSQSEKTSTIRVFVFGHTERAVQKTFKRVNEEAKKHNATDTRSVPTVQDHHKDTNIPDELRDEHPYRYQAERTYDFTD